MMIFSLPGIADDADNCQFVANNPQTDTDNDGIGDGCDEDANNGEWNSFSSNVRKIDF